MYKTVNFNIFEENLEDIVYRDDSVFQNTKDDPAGEMKAEKITGKSTELVIKPLVDLRPGRESERK